MFTVAYDFDGVINNLPEVWTDYLNNMYQYEVNALELKYYDMTKNFKDISYNGIMWPLSSSSLWEKVELKLDADKYIIQLIEKGIKVLIVSATDPEIWNVKYNYCFKRLLPNFPVENIILCNNKSLIKSDVIIDDYDFNLRNCDGYKILFDASYNRYTDVFINQRCNDHQQIYETILDLKNN